LTRKIAKQIAASEARVLAGKVLFGDDWIGELSSADLQILESKNGIKKKTLPNGRAINIIVPCPRGRRNRLNAAIGRGERAVVQLSTAIDVMHDAGFSHVAEAYDFESFERFLKSFRRRQFNGGSNPVGKPPDKIEGVKRRMESDMRGGIDLGAMKQKALAAKYDVSRGTAVKARQEVCEKHARK
jgi:hypothetical protein